MLRFSCDEVAKKVTAQIFRKRLNDIVTSHCVMPLNFVTVYFLEFCFT